MASPDGHLARRCAALVSRRPVALLAVAVVLAALCIILTALRLQFQADRNDLLSRSIPWNQRFIDWLDHFPGANDLIIVVQTDPVDEAVQARARSFVNDLVPLLRADPNLEDVEWGASTGEFAPKAARLAPMPQFEQILDEAAAAEPVLRLTTPGELLEDVNRRIVQNRSFGDPDATPEEVAGDVRGLTRFVVAIDESFRSPERAPSVIGRLAEDPRANDWIYLKSPNGRLLFVQVSPRE